MSQTGSSYFSDFEEFFLSEMTSNSENILSQGSDHDVCSFESNLDDEANDFINCPTTNNVFYPNLDQFEKTFFQHSSMSRFKASLRNSLEHEIDQDNRMHIFEDPTMNTSECIAKSQSVSLNESPSEDDHHCVSPDIFGDSSDDETMCDHQDELKPVTSVVEKSRPKQALIAKVETFLIKLLQDIVSNGNAKIMMVDCTKWENCEMSNGKLTLKEPTNLTYRNVNLQQLKCRYHFAMIMYVLSEVYHLLITNTTCTERELYYDDPELAENQLRVTSAVRDVCNMLKTSPWELGIYSSSKGLIAGAVRIHMSNSVVIDCYMYDKATLIPGDAQAIAFLETTAKFVLIIEKDTVFEKLLDQNILINLPSDIILITGKGFPDLSTRLIVKRLWDDFRLPIYALVDADPFGIEIMFVYRFGSKAMVLNSDSLACPQIRWIGIQPSEIDMLAIPSVAQSSADKKKVIELLQRSYVSGKIRDELELLQRLGRKAEIEGVASFSANFLVSDYIPNKIKRDLVI